MPEGPTAGMGFLGGGSESPSHQLGVLDERCKLSQRDLGRIPGKFGFWSILGPQKSRQNGQLAFESGIGQQMNMGARAPSWTAPDHISISLECRIYDRVDRSKTIEIGKSSEKTETNGAAAEVIKIRS